MSAVVPGDWAFVRSIIDALPDHIYAKDRQSRFTVVNKSLAETFGVAAPEQMIGKSDFDLFPRDVAQWFYDEEQELMRTGNALPNREAAVTDPSGRQRWFLTNKVPLRDASGQITGLVGVNRDITDRKQVMHLQLQLAQAEKMESIGRLAAGVAHEVKNPLAVLVMGIDYLNSVASAATRIGSAGTGEPAPTPAADPAAFSAPAVLEVLRRMKDAVTRADRVVRGLLDFSMPTTLAIGEHDLHPIIEHALGLIKPQMMRAKVTLQKDFAPGLPPVRVDPNKAEQVFVNLLMNAVHATPPGGTITVRTYSRGAMESAAGVQVHSELDQPPFGTPGWVFAEIDDTGSGTPPELLSRLFEPFFTTKASGQGSGLGLSVCRTIVELHGGTIDLYNRPEGGMGARIGFKAARH